MHPQVFRTKVVSSMRLVDGLTGASAASSRSGSVSGVVLSSLSSSSSKQRKEPFN